MIAKLHSDLPLPLAGRRLVGLFAHPDDEAWGAAALLAGCARLGARVTVISATHGEAAGRFGAGARRHSAEELRALRSHELAASCRVLGLQQPRLLDFPDGGLMTLDQETLGRRLAAAVADEQPQVVVSHGHDGAYGHRDHLCVAAAARSLPAYLGARAPQRIVSTEFPRGLFTPLRRALRRHPTLIDDDWRQRALGIDSSQVALRIRLGAHQQARKLQAIACHRSQLAHPDPRRFLAAEIIDALLAEEWFGLVHGPPPPAAAEHPFAGLDGGP